ncbi:unnamed protein product [Linum trigynum]|uniref:Uncharacterized protein n=1 Tax=Linum trigynum TaxID=586398 RepID=A0AAV2ESS3_9ROSI
MNCNNRTHFPVPLASPHQRNMSLIGGVISDLATTLSHAISALRHHEKKIRRWGFWLDFELVWQFIKFNHCVAITVSKSEYMRSLQGEELRKGLNFEAMFGYLEQLKGLFVAEKPNILA